MEYKNSLESIVKDIINNKLYISAVKQYRAYTGCGLKDAITAIQGCIDPASDGYGSVYSIWDKDAILALFNLSNGQEDISKLLNGLNVVLENWKQLGFETPYDACEQVIKNFKKS